MVSRWFVRKAAALALVSAVSLPALGCVQVGHDHGHKPSTTVRKNGPPPHAPAHGYRRKHRDGVELVFDRKIGVYVVVGHAHIYFHDDHFYRFADGWQISARFGGKWIAVRSDRVPPGLAGKNVGKHKRKDKHGHGPPAKHGY